MGGDYAGPYRVEIRKAGSPEVRGYDMGETLWGEGSFYWWEEGNFSCDCNRSIVWGWTHGRFILGDVLPPCGDGGYVVRCIAPDGSVLYTDESW